MSQSINYDIYKFKYAQKAPAQLKKYNIPEVGHAYRSEVSETLPTCLRRRSWRRPYQNDDHEMASRRKEAEIGTSVRDNKTPNAVCIGLAITVVLFAMNPNARAVLKTRWHALRKAI